LQVVNTSLEKVYRDLVVDSKSLDVLGLPEPNDTPTDERSQEFAEALEAARVNDLEYLVQLQALENAARDDDFALSVAERSLRDRVRSQLGLPPRPSRKTISIADHARSLAINPSIELESDGASDQSDDDRRLQTLKWADVLDGILDRIAEDARLSEQESGLSTLFLAFGFLEWSEHQNSEKRLFAPLLLLPVKLDKRKTLRGKSVFSLSATADTADANLSLQKKLELDFGIAFPELSVETQDQHGVEGYFEHVREAIADQNQWRVRRWLTLGHFAFGRFAMYADLAADSWPEHPSKHSLVGAVIRGTEITGDGGESLLTPPADYSIDDPQIEAIAPILVHDADASQHSALVDVMKDRNLVIQGPPGTGKSQTITNIISNLLAAGKTVLFLAEKQAALEVVKRRLDVAALGDFCLELHSDKSTPKSVVQSLRSRYALGVNKRTKHSKLQADIGWEESRRELNRYIKALHERQEDGQSPFDLIWHSIRATTHLEATLERIDASSLPERVLRESTDFDDAARNLSLYSRMADDFAKRHKPPSESLAWACFEFKPALNASAAQRLIGDVRKLMDSATALASAIEAAADVGIRSTEGLIAATKLNDVLSLAPPEQAFLKIIGDLEAASVEGVITIQSELARLERQCSEYPEIEHVTDNIRELAHNLEARVAGSQYAGLTPAEAYRRCKQNIELCRAAKIVLTAAQPLIEHFGSGREFSASAVETVYCAAFAVTKLPDEIRKWFFWEPVLGWHEYEQVRALWTELVKQEAKWRARFPRTQADGWPAPDELRAAATVLRKSAMSRLILGISGKTKIVSAVTAQLGLTEGTPLLPADLEALAAHSELLSGFISNRVYSQMFGDSWRGLDTSFELIEHSRKVRATVQQQVSKLPQGELVYARLRERGIEATERLVGLCELLRTEMAAHPEYKTLLGPASIEETLESAASMCQVAEAVLAVDPERELDRFRISLDELDNRLRLYDRLREVRNELAQHPYSMSARHFGSDGAASARHAVRWKTLVRDSAVPSELKLALLSERAPVSRNRLTEIARLACNPLAEVRTGLDNMFEHYGTFDAEHNDPVKLIEQCRLLLSEGDCLGEFLSLAEQRQILVEKGLGSFLDQVEGLNLAHTKIPEAFSGLVAMARARELRRSDPVLSRASGLRIEARRKEFIERDRAKITDDRRKTQAALLSSAPPSGSQYGPRKTWTEMGLLANEFGKERGFAPVRDLIHRAGKAIQTLKPCFMMSPLSLAKFLPIGALRFDVLVIDEASQMRPEDALGGLLRAHQVVVVGDQKQLPPTDFFSRAVETGGPGVDEDDFADVDDESILEACQKAFKQTRMLRWHYRSRCESLISFSNREFYKGDLITFPMARPGSFSVDLVRVDGSYEARRNPAESQRLAEEAIRFMRHHADWPSDAVPTLGIVAVNSEQRELISEELRQLSSGDELVERYVEKVAAKGEAVFVKNLENVQGDERDFILISMTYGPKPGSSVLLQRFGPINGKQGHRRLNVLFSRARTRIVLFTSFGSEDVKPTELSSEGVRVLRRYFEFAETRGRVQGETTGREPDSDFELEVADRLIGRGYDVQLQVGVSGFRIDLGVKDPEHPHRFLAGIECDGASYHSSKSARDRDRLREEVLRELGWTLLRVWSTDWFDNPGRQTDLLVEQLERLKSTPRAARDSYEFQGIGAYTNDRQSFSAEPSNGQQPIVIDNISSSCTAELGNAPNDRSQSETDLVSKLQHFRETVIATELENWDRHRSILRDSMIETIVAQRLTDPADWFLKVPQFQRSGTNPIERQRFLEKICALVAESESSSSPEIRSRSGARAQVQGQLL
jgi:very-short-patch-repair endonuclease